MLNHRLSRPWCENMICWDNNFSKNVQYFGGLKFYICAFYQKFSEVYTNRFEAKVEGRRIMSY